jgi:hypothetical protein
MRWDCILDEHYKNGFHENKSWRITWKKKERSNVQITLHFCREAEG